MDVTASVRNGNYAELATQIRLALQSVKFPLEYRAELLPGYGDRLANTNRMVRVAVAAAIGILLLMQVAFGSWRLAGAVFLTLPVALAGGALGA